MNEYFGLTHIDNKGQARMVNISDKDITRRTAEAEARVVMDVRTARLLSQGSIAKGDAIAVARVAGIAAAKRTWELIPLCHNIDVAEVVIEVSIDERRGEVMIQSRVVSVDRTGAEMEALTAVSVAALTIYDMCKAVDKGITITDVKLSSKTGGASGDWCWSGSGGNGKCERESLP